MALGSKVDNAVNLLLLHQFVEGVEVADIHLDKLIVWLILYILKVCKVACVGQFIKVDDIILRVLIDKKAHNVATNKTCTASDNDVFHTIAVLICLYNES